MSDQVPIKYVTFTRPKADGGVRTICAPVAPLKEVQKGIYKMLLGLRIPPGPFLHAHVKRRSTRTNARALQVKNKGVYRTLRFLVKIDVKDFFPSLTDEVVLEACRDELVPDKIIELIDKYCFMEVGEKRILPQGAPTSPILSNLVMKQIGRRMSGLIRKWNQKYHFVTKMAIYCDNISFASDSDKIRGLVYPLQRILQDYGLEVKWRKYEHHASPARKMVCGVVMDSGGEVLAPPKEYWKSLRAMIHNAYIDLKAELAPPGYMLRKDTRKMIRSLGKREGQKGIVKWQNLGKRVFRVMQSLDKEKDCKEIPWDNWRGRISYVSSLNPERGKQLTEMLDRLEEETQRCLMTSKSTKKFASAATP